MTPKRKYPSGPSGQHTSPRRILSEKEPGQFARWDDAVERSGARNWAEWVRGLLDRAARKRSA